MLNAERSSIVNPEDGFGVVLVAYLVNLVVKIKRPTPRCRNHELVGRQFGSRTIYSLEDRTNFFNGEVLKRDDRKSIVVKRANQRIESFLIERSLSFRLDRRAGAPSVVQKAAMLEAVVAGADFAATDGCVTRNHSTVGAR